MEANIQFLSNHFSNHKQIPGVLYHSLLPTITVSLDTQELVVPYGNLSKTLLPEIKEIDFLLRDQVYQLDGGQEYITLESTISVLQTTAARISMTAPMYLRLLLDYVRYVHLGRIDEGAGSVSWIP